MGTGIRCQLLYAKTPSPFSYNKRYGMQNLPFRRFPNTRLRRLRTRPFARVLTAETTLSVRDLILPLFICENEETERNIPAMPGIRRVPLNALTQLAKQINRLGIPALALFPVIASSTKTPYGLEARNPDGLIPRAVRQLKKTVPALGLITDLALDPYTSHGHDGVTDASGTVLNDGTLTLLRDQALCLAEAGSDILAPSDMMDGRIGFIRAALEEAGFTDTLLLSYAAKYASAFYGPFRSALGSRANLGTRDKRGYQMDPANSDEALHEVALDLKEGADMVMVKPGLGYLDIVHRVKTQFGVPTLAYQVSGEYAMLKLAGQANDNEAELFLETLLAFKRAGADAILSYYALTAARLLGSA